MYISDLKYTKHQKLTGESSGVMQVKMIVGNNVTKVYFLNFTCALMLLYIAFVYVGVFSSTAAVRLPFLVFHCADYFVMKYVVYYAYNLKVIVTVTV